MDSFPLIVTNLGRIFGQLTIEGLAAPPVRPNQEIDLPISSLDAGWQTLLDAVLSTLSMVRSAHVVGNVTGHIKYFALDDDLVPLNKPLTFALPQIQRNSGYACRDDYRRCKLQHLRPASAKWNRTFADNLLSEITWRLNFTKFRSDRLVRTQLPRNHGSMAHIVSETLGMGRCDGSRIRGEGICRRLFTGKSDASWFRIS
jgi:hypothetical protein